MTSKRQLTLLTMTSCYQNLTSGIRGVANSWFTSYLFKQHQSVHINDEMSTKREITCGVLQGSILEPLLFLIYINDMHHAVCKSKIYHFADDIKFVILM